MGRATFPFRNRLAVVFDFDGTLAPDTLDEVLKKLDVDPDAFHEERIDPLVDDGWDALIAVFYALVEATRRGELVLTHERIHELGASLKPFGGVPELFDRVREKARAAGGDDVEVEFYLLTCGLVDFHRAMDIASEFTGMWGSEFHFEDDGRIGFVKQIITHPEKTRYLLQLAKGLSPEGPNGPADVYRHVDVDDWHLPLDQIVYVGDGVSDMPAFSLMSERGGLALGVVDADQVDEWEGHDGMHAGRRVQNLAKADYTEGSELLQSLLLAVESIGKLIALRRLGEGE